MKWQLKSETDKSRTYINEQSGTESITDLIYTDAMGNNWYAFRDLFKIPYIRKEYASRFTQLFGIGLTPEDLRQWNAKEKAILKSNDPEKYEKIYALLLEREATIETTIDPMKGHLALASLYVLGNDERVDYYSYEDGIAKIKVWDLDINAKSFFLTWLDSHISDYMRGLNNLSQIALNQQEGQTVQY
jgi:hypothetical protein